eukprot:PhF_6_TR11553/c0_g1_i1/m.18568
MLRLDLCPVCSKCVRKLHSRKAMLLLKGRRLITLPESYFTIRDSHKGTIPWSGATLGHSILSTLGGYCMWYGRITCERPVYGLDDSKPIPSRWSQIIDSTYNVHGGGCGLRLACGADNTTVWIGRRCWAEVPRKSTCVPPRCLGPNPAC